MTYDELINGMKETREVLTQAERLGIIAIEFCEGKLRRLSENSFNFIGSTTLCRLKKELRGWDMNKRKWK